MANVILPIIKWTTKPNARYTSNQTELKKQLHRVAKVEYHMELLVLVSDLAASEWEQTLKTPLSGL